MFWKRLEAEPAGDHRAAATRPKTSVDSAEMANARQITTPSSRDQHPGSDQTQLSPATVKMKSVCCSGTKPARVCEPWNSP